MNEIRAYTLFELRSLFGINRAMHTKDPKERKRYGLLGASFALLILLVIFYIAALVYGLCILGLASIVPAYLTVISSALILVFGLFKAGNAVFGSGSYDLLASMPLRTRTLVIGRFLTLYIEDLLLTGLIILPGCITYAVCMPTDALFYLFLLIGLLCIPAIPSVFSILFGTLIMAATSRMKHKALGQTVLMLAFVVLTLLSACLIPAEATELSVEKLTELATYAGELLGSIYPPAAWLSQAVIYGDPLYMLLFAGISLVLLAGTVWLVILIFHPIMHRLQGFSAKHDYQMERQENRSLAKALFFKEWKRYFSSSVYVTNTIVGPILGLILSVALLVSGMDVLRTSLPFAVDIVGLFPFLFSLVFCMMSTTSVSISMEGKQFWLLKSLPIPAKTLFDSKLLLNLSLMAPFYLISEILLIIALRPTLWEAVWLILIPLLMILFEVVIGITINLKFHSFDWENETAVVKQSASTALGGFAGPLVAILLGAITLPIPQGYADLAKGGICLLLATVTCLLYRKNNQTDLEAL